MGARVVWDHEVAGSIPVTPTNNHNKWLKFSMRVSYIGNTPAFQAGKVGSIPTTRSNKDFIKWIWKKSWQISIKILK